MDGWAAPSSRGLALEALDPLLDFGGSSFMELEGLENAIRPDAELCCKGSWPRHCGRRKQRRMCKIASSKQVSCLAHI